MVAETDCRHGTCTVVFVVVAAIIVFCISSIQTLNKISWLGWVGATSILAAVITLAIAVGVQDRPSAAPATGPFDKNVQAAATPTFVQAMNAVNTVLFAYAGSEWSRSGDLVVVLMCGLAPNFMPVVSEMRKIEDYPKSVVLCQTFVTVVYCVGPPCHRVIGLIGCR